MRRSFFCRLTAAALSLILLDVPAASALTAEQCAELLELVYVDEIPPEVLEQPTIEGMLTALGDPYTQYFTAEEYADFMASMADSSLVGIGVVYNSTEDGLLIGRVLDGSPALDAGLEPGDLIVAVDGKSVLGQSDDTVIGWIQGEEGTPVKIAYLRDGDLISVTLTRATVVIPATTVELVDGHIGYISCSTFGNETVGYFQDAIEKYDNQADVWIVDLRENFGGITNAATVSASFFTGAGDMAYLRNGANEYGVYQMDESPMTIDPVIVLVNGHSASAAEVFASAVRDNGAGIVVGTRTFGKGVAQTVLDQSSMPEYFSAGDAIKITSHRFFSPLGNTTDCVGVIPDLLVPHEYIGDVAYLLSASAPDADSGNLLRLHMNWRWYIDLDPLAEEPGYRDALAVLLDAIPTDLDYVELWCCTDTAVGWHQTSPQEVAEEFELSYISPNFPDEADSDYAAVLRLMKTYDLISGYDDGLFHPKDTLTRAQFCQLLAMALNCNVPDSPSPYADVAEDAWYKDAVTAISNLGLVRGDGEGFFHPDDPIDHQQFITIMGRMAKWINMHLYDAALLEMPQDLSQETQLTDYADWAKPSAWLMSAGWDGAFFTSVNLLWAPVDEIAATQATTRDEAVFTLCNLLFRTGVLPRNRNVLID